ncbi:MAG: secondary thiamine-phosphate synthase enzyme YjbQ [Candidatus Odinarchaeota archaeon]
MSKFSSYPSVVKITTRGENDIVDITWHLNALIEKSGIDDGLINVIVPGATGAITTIEYEPGLLQDFPDLMEKLVPKNHQFQHNERNYDDNGHSHCRASLIGPSLTLNFKQKRLVTGTWQQVVFLEFDTRSRERILDIMIIGVCHD